MATGPLRIAIIGAGIGGLTLSAALGLLGQDRALQVDVYESTSEISAIGAGITFWPRQWRIMKALGLDEELQKFSPAFPDDMDTLVFQIRKSDQEEGLHVDDLIIKGGTYRFHRADLQSTLMSHMKGTLHLNHQLTSFEYLGEEVVLTFSNGSTAKCDLLIGMDGIKSKVRKCMLLRQGLGDSPSMEPTWMGQVMYRGLVTEDSLKEKFPNHRALNTPMLYSGQNKQIITYPVKHTTTLINIGAVVTEPLENGDKYTQASTEVPRSELMSLHSHYEPEVRALLSRIERPTKWPLKWLVPLEKYTHGRVILGGDAAHAMPPYQGAGAGAAMEDAYILASLISHPAITKANVRQVADVYDMVRTSEGNRVLNGSIACGDISQLRGFNVNPDDINRRYGESDLKELKEHFGKLSEYFEWVWRDNAEEGRIKAISALEERLTAPVM